MRRASIPTPSAVTLLALCGPQEPREPPNMWANKSSEEIIAEIRAMLTQMSDMPFRPETAIIELPTAWGACW